MGLFTKNILHTFSTQVIGFFVGIATSIIITRGLGPEGKGLFALAMVVSSLLMMGAGLGLNQAVMYYVAAKKYAAKEALGSTLILALLISAAAIFIGLILITFFHKTLFPGVPRNYLFLAVSFFPLAYIIDLLSSVSLGLEKIKIYNNIKLLIAALYVVFVGIIFAFSTLTVGAAISVNIVTYAIAGILLFFLTAKASGGTALRLHKKYVKDIFSYGIKAYPATLAYLFRPQINVYLVNYLLNPAAVGFYVTAFALSEFVQWFARSTATVLFPKVAAQTDKEKLKEFTPIVCRNVLCITFLGATFLFIAAKLIITLLYSGEFLSSVLPFQIMLIGTVASAGWTILNTDLFARGKPIINTYIFNASLIINVGLNLLLIPSFGIMGAAWGLTISYLLMFLLTLIAYARLSGNTARDILLVKYSDAAYYGNIWAAARIIFLRKRTNL